MQTLVIGGLTVKDTEKHPCVLLTTCYFSIRILLEVGVQNRVADLVTNLICEATQKGRDKFLQTGYNYTLV